MGSPFRCVTEIVISHSLGALSSGQYSLNAGQTLDTGTRQTLGKHSTLERSTLEPSTLGKYGGFWEALFVVSQKWSFPTALGRIAAGCSSKPSCPITAQRVSAPTAAPTPAGNLAPTDPPSSGGLPIGTPSQVSSRTPTSSERSTVPCSAWSSMTTCRQRTSSFS